MGQTRARGWMLAAGLGLALTAVGPAWGQTEYRLEGGQWQAQTQPDPQSPEGQLQAIRRLLAEDKPAQARKAAGRWIKRYPNHPMLVDAHLLRGDARVADGNEYKALFDYEMVIRAYPGTEQFNLALEREFAIASLYAQGRRRQFLGMRIVAAGDEAAEIFIRIQERVPGSELGEKAVMALGDYYYRRGEMRNAVDAYDMFLVNYPRSQQREKALLRLVQANLATFRGPQFDATGLIEGAQRIRQYQQEYPASAERLGADALLVRIDESMGLKVLASGNWYRRRGLDLSAATLYQRVIQDHGQTAAARAAVAELRQMGQPLVAGAEPETQPDREGERE